jgi:peptidoglycan hydrolase-like protein with peptidoglycan-binding domain
MEYLAYSHLVLANTEANPDADFSLPEIQFNLSWKKHFKSAWLTFASVGVLAAILAQAQMASATYYGPGYKYYVTTDGGPLNIRRYPSSNANVVGQYYNGSRLPRVIGYRNGFAHLDGGNWVAARWIGTTRGSDYNPYNNDNGYPYNENGSPQYNSRPGVGGEIYLSIGSQGPLVSRLQRRLGLRTTGSYDYTTAYAVRRYQRSVGLTPDGVVGPTTANSLFD